MPTFEWYGAVFTEPLDWAGGDVSAHLVDSSYQPNIRHQVLGDVKGLLDASTPLSGRAVVFDDRSGETRFQCAQIAWERVTAKDVGCVVIAEGDRLVAFGKLDRSVEVYEGAFEADVDPDGILRLRTLGKL
jgi:hypothetical protein